MTPRSTKTPQSRRLAQFALLLSSALLPVQAMASPADTSSPARPTAGRPMAVAAAPDEPGVRFDHHAVFEFEPAAKAVHVRHELTIANTQSDRVVGNYIRQSYLPRLGVPVVAQAVGLTATKAGGASLPVQPVATESPFVAIAEVDLQPDVFSGQSQSLTLTYDLPAVPPRSFSFVRVNDAFVTFPVFLDGDPGRTSIEVRIPSGFEVEVVGSEMERDERDGVTVLSAALADPTAFFASVVARNDDALVSKEVDLDGSSDVVVRAWPGDSEWAAFAATQARHGIPDLEEAIGLDWPASSDIDLVETAAPYLYGYAGWYQPVESLIEVGDELDARVILHELSHVWFNDELFTDRWISEGLAEVFAAYVEAKGGKIERPDPIDRAAPGAILLNDWGTPDIQAGNTFLQEAFGYNASWFVIDAISKEIGIDGLAEVVRLADAGTYAYDGPGLPDATGRGAGWPQLLDLLEERAESSTALDLFAAHVVGTADAERFAARTASRGRYTELVEEGGGWLPPAAVRIAMANWRFDTADRLMKEATAVLQTKSEVEEQLDGLDATAAALRTEFEASRDLDDLAVSADEAAKVAGRLRAAQRAADRSVGPIGTIGLLFRNPDARLDRAEAAFTAGDYTRGDRLAASTIGMVDDATRDGLLRLLALVVLVLMAGLVRRAVRARKRRRAAAREAADVAAGEDEPLALDLDGVRDPER